MNFVQHSLHWLEGEIFEGTLIAVFGVLTILTGVLFWRLGDTPNAKAMLIPLLAVGLLLAAAGTAGYFSNQKRIGQFERAYHEHVMAFVEAEKSRVEGFESLYTFTLILAPVCFALAIVFFWVSLNPHLRAVGIALALVGLSGLVIDSFSKERADVYLAKIQAELEVLRE